MDNPKKMANLSYLILALGIVGYAIFFVTYSLQKHYAFQTAGYDLGNYAQAFWNTLQGKPLAITTVASISSRWQAHFEPTLLLFVPIYALHPTASTLLILQVLIVVIGVIPIFLIARQKLQSNRAGLLFATVYLLFPALQAGLVFDFHSVTIAVTFFSFGLWFLLNQRYAWLTLILLLAMGFKEDLPLVVFMIAGYIFWGQRNWRWAVIIAGLAIAWFVIINFWAIPAISPRGENIQLSRYGQWGDSMGQIIITIITHPEEVIGVMFTGDKLRYWMRALLPVAFVALLAPLVVAMALPVMVINTLSSTPPNYQLDQFHYSVVIVPFIVTASIIGVQRLIDFATPKFNHLSRQFLQNTLLTTILFATVAYQFQFGHTPLGRYFEWPVVTHRHQAIQAILAEIPPDASVAAQNNLVPHLSEREWLFTLPMTATDEQQAEYIALDTQGPPTFYKHVGQYCEHISELGQGSDYGLIASHDGFYLFKEGEADVLAWRLPAFCR